MEPTASVSSVFHHNPESRFSENLEARTGSFFHQESSSSWYWKVIGVSNLWLFLLESSFFYFRRLLRHTFFHPGIGKLLSNRRPAITIHESIYGIPQGRGRPRASAANTETIRFQQWHRYIQPNERLPCDRRSFPG